jgi:hypothetical protein
MKGSNFMNRNTVFTSTLLAFAYVALCPITIALTPAPDGGYANFTTAEGQNALLRLSGGTANTAVGWSSLFNVTTGSFNTGIGAAALALNTGDNNTGTGVAALLLNTTGTNNTADGTATLVHNATGDDNTAVGAFALNNNIASGNTAIGSNALLNNTTGGTLGNINIFDVGPNVAVGRQALESNTVASANTAVGYQALQSFTTGPIGFEQVGLCTAVGFQALAHTTGDGFANSGFGYQALVNNTDGSANTAVGFEALQRNVGGGGNTATGSFSLGNNQTGDANTAVGGDALVGNIIGNGNTAVGSSALQDNTAGFFNTAIGLSAGANITGTGNVCIGQGVFGEGGVDSTTYIRNVNTFAQNFSAGVNDYVTVRLSDGRLGHTAVVSSRRYKEDIQALDTKSEGLYALKPVSFRLKKEYDETQTPGFGLIAEDVEKVNPDLVYRNNKGQVESVRYEMVNAMLLNEFLKEHETVQELKKEVEALTIQLKEHARGTPKRQGPACSR